MKRIFIFLVALFVLIIGYTQLDVSAASKTLTDDVAETIPYITDVITSIENENQEKTATSFQAFKEQWFDIKNDIRSDSLPIYSKIQTQLATVSLNVLNEDGEKATASLTKLKKTLIDYSKGNLAKDGSSTEEANIASYLQLLDATAASIEMQHTAQATNQVAELRTKWLQIEGDIVSKSQQVYTNSERNLVLLAGYTENEQTEKSLQTIEAMKADLTPFVNSTYGIWDAALIPIREGLEALLVIGALLAFTKKREETKGTRWVWGGIGLGLLVSLAIGFTVSFLLNASSFGQNNFIINGATGIFASLMLLYVSYWLHRNSNVKRWNNFIRQKSEKTLGNGKMISFAMIAFLAVLREGMETVIFLIGMANRMPISDLILGIGTGFGILIVLGVFMLKLGKKLPLKPFFLVSSLIVFYMCIKFMGSGIHSLQLAGYIPSTINEMIPTISFLGIYPSWSSTLPQLIIIMLAVSMVAIRQLKTRRAI